MEGDADAVQLSGKHASAQYATQDRKVKDVMLIVEDVQRDLALVLLMAIAVFAQQPDDVFELVQRQCGQCGLGPGTGR